MATLLTLIGLPSSGKSLLAGKISRLSGFPIISIDKIREDLGIALGDSSKHQRLFKVAYERIEHLLKDNRGVIYDATNIDPFFRSKFLSRMRRNGATMVGIFVNTPCAVCLERNAKKESGKIVPKNEMESMDKLLNENLSTISNGLDHFYEINETLDITVLT